MFGRKSNEGGDTNAAPKPSASRQEVLRTQAVPPTNGSTETVKSMPKDNANKKQGLESVEGDGVVLIGKGTRIVGQISDCSLIEIQGDLEGNISSDVVVVRDGGRFKGELIAQQAEVHGVVDGKVTVSGLLDVRATGKVTGELNYGQFAVAVGASVVGNLVGPGMDEKDNAGQSKVELADTGKLNSHSATNSGAQNGSTAQDANSTNAPVPPVSS